MKRAAAGVVAVAALLFIGAWAATCFESVDLWLYRVAVTRVVSQPDLQLAKPGELSVLLCGTGSPLPDPQRAGACTLIAAGDRLYVVDSGLGSTKNLLLWHVPLQKIAGVFLTHFHSDHIAELGELRLQTWGAGRKMPLKVYGPPGVDDVVTGFNKAYSHDADYRTAHHGEQFLPREAVNLVAVAIPMIGATAPALREYGLAVTAIRVHHDPVKPAYGYRFDFGGRSISVSGDTAAYLPLAQAARGSDVLVHEAQSNVLVGVLGDAMTAAGRARPAKIMHDIPGYHTTPTEAARIANAAHVKLLIFTHINPPLPFAAIAEPAFLAGVSYLRPGGWLLGHDGMVVRLPGHGDAIEQSDIN
jgi:ribonuclease Z